LYLQKLNSHSNPLDESQQQYQHQSAAMSRRRQRQRQRQRQFNALPAYADTRWLPPSFDTSGFLAGMVVLLDSEHHDIVTKVRTSARSSASHSYR
jgi:hypothetical protein